MSTAKPLTKAEKAWLAELEGVFMRCPSGRLGMYTVGDPTLYVYDKEKRKAWEEANQRRTMDVIDASELDRRAGSALGHMSTSGLQIDSCTG